MIRLVNFATSGKETLFGTSLGHWGLWFAVLIAAISLTALALFNLYPPGDLVLSRVVQSVRVPGINLVSEFIYRIGLSPYFLLVTFAVGMFMTWRRHKLMAVFIALTAVTRIWAVLIKELVERPRPSPLAVDVSEQANGFSFPSGHVLGAVLLWGFIFFASEQIITNPRTRIWVRWSSLAIIVLMGLQRVYAGAHWPSDVLGAYLWGGVLLFALVKSYEFCGRCRPEGGMANSGFLGPDL